MIEMHQIAYLYVKRIATRCIFHKINLYDILVGTVILIFLSAACILNSYSMFTR